MNPKANETPPETPLTVRSKGSECNPLGQPCKTCLSNFYSPNGSKVYCSDRCRFLHWAAKELAKEQKARRVEGLQYLIASLTNIAETNK
jgi:hypothetical protein